jgi:hypothetical protein
MILGGIPEIEGELDIRKSRDAMGTNYGWFYIHFLVSMKDLQAKKLNAMFPEQFAYKNSIRNGWYCSHFDKDEINKISKSNIVEIFKYNNKNKKNVLSGNGDYLIKSIRGWKPSYSVKNFSSLGLGYYSVKGVDYYDLLTDPDVQSIEKYHPHKLRNRYTVGYLQSGTDELVTENMHMWTSRSIHQRGIRGEGQIITISDTGIDTNSSFFYDKDVPVPFGKKNDKHRKIIRYETLADNIDSWGHGTHVTGTATGKSWDNNSASSLYDGHAPDAKLFFIDVYNGEFADFDAEKYLGMADEYGSGIYSASWGPEGYNQETEIMDNLAYKYKNILISVAPGNNGPNPATIESPADGINIFAVGNANKESYYYQNYMYSNFVLKLNNGKTIKLNYLNFNMNKLYDENSHIIDLSNIKVSKDPIENSIYLVPLDTSFEEALVNAKKQNCLFTIFLNSKINYGINISNRELCFFYIDENSYNTLSILGDATVSFTLTLNDNNVEVDDSSARGPTRKGVSKPDIIAPGCIIYSANSNVEDPNDVSLKNIIKMEGTSMATPAISGSATLLREYFVKGYYPSLKQNSSNSIIPAASLLKAALINSATPFNNDKKSDVRTNDYGYGIPNLEKAMGFDKTIGVIYINNQSIKQLSSHTYSVEVNEEGNISVTLSYTDYPVNYYSYSILTATINLVVEYDGKVYGGNGKDYDELYTANSKVIIPNNKKGTIKIHVICSDYPEEANIEYSLAISGPVTTGLKLEKKENSECPSSCSSNGKCVNGMCQCTSNYSGTYCQTSVKYAELGKKYSGTNEWTPEWFKYDIKKGSKLVLTIYPTVKGPSIICLSEDQSPIGSIGQSCFQSSGTEYNYNIQTNSTSLYLTIHSTIGNDIYSFMVEEKNEVINDKTNDKKVKELTIAVIVLSVIIFVLIVSLVILFLFRNKKDNDNTSDDYKEATLT